MIPVKCDTHRDKNASYLNWACREMVCEACAARGREGAKFLDQQAFIALCSTLIESLDALASEVQSLKGKLSLARKGTSSISASEYLSQVLEPAVNILGFGRHACNLQAAAFGITKSAEVSPPNNPYIDKKFEGEELKELRL
jgi:hypothetical protein